jgi:uncharacterized membrane protein YccC
LLHYRLIRGAGHDRRPLACQVRGPDLALKTFSPAILALVIALWMDLPRPYWTMATVYVTTQPLAGATRSKAAYRLPRRLVGAVVAIGTVPNHVNAPELLCLVIALWIRVCLYLSLLDGTPRSYASALSGYTTAIIGFPSVSDPGGIFDTAIARAQEISLGIICATIVSTMLVPRSSGRLVSDRLTYWPATATILSRDAHSGGTDDSKQQFQRLLREASEIEGLEAHLAYDRLTDVATASGFAFLRIIGIASTPNQRSKTPDLVENLRYRVADVALSGLAMTSPIRRTM